MVVNVEENAIMPLSETLSELNSMSELIRRAQRFNNELLNCKDSITNCSRIHVVGSGESYILAKAAVHLFAKKCEIPVLAWQSYEFISQANIPCNDSDLVIILTSSGRPSPIIDALEQATAHKAKTICITNDANAWQAEITADHFISTSAVKKGMPTQSTVGTWLALQSLRDLMVTTSPSQFWGKTNARIADEVARLFQQVDALPTDFFRTATDPLAHVSCLGVGYGIYAAESMANLLACGPQIDANYFPIEEYHHSLRMLQPQQNKIIFIFTDASTQDLIIKCTATELIAKGAVVVVIGNHKVRNERSTDSAASSQINIALGDGFDREALSLLLFIAGQRLCLNLAKVAMDSGLKRVSLQEVVIS